MDETKVKQLLQRDNDNVVADDDAIAGVPTKAATAHVAPATLSGLCAVILCH